MRRGKRRAGKGRGKGPSSIRARGSVKTASPSPAAVQVAAVAGVDNHDCALVPVSARFARRRGSRLAVCTAIVAVVGLMAAQMAVVMRARAALVDPHWLAEARLAVMMPALPASLDLRPRPDVPADPGMVIVAALAPLGHAFDTRPLPDVPPDPTALVTAALEPLPFAYDGQPRPQVPPDPGAVILASLAPFPPAFDARARAEVPPDPTILVAMMLPALPHRFDMMPRPDVPPEAAGPAVVTAMPLWPRLLDKDAGAGQPSGSGRVHFARHVVGNCLPGALVGVLHQVGKRFGQVTIISGFRSRRHNRRVGGASRSLHMSCRAIDFKVNGNGRAVLNFLRRHGGVGGYKRYRGGSFHIDNGPRRTW